MSQLLLLGVGKNRSGINIAALGATSGYSASRLLNPSYGGALTTLNTGQVETFHDQSGNGRDITQATAANRPFPDTAGPLSRDSIFFNAANVEYLASSANMSSFISVSAAYVVISILPTNMNTNIGSTSDGTIWGSNSSGGVQLMTVGHATLAQNRKLKVHNNDGSADFTFHGITEDAAHVVEILHTGGALSIRIDLGNWFSIASGNTASLAHVMNLGTGAAKNVANSYHGHVFELTTFDAVPSDVVKEEIVRDFAAQIGITDKLGLAYTEPPFSEVVLLVEFEGADASTTFTDISNVGRTLTTVGDAQVDTADFKFGSASGLFDGSGDSITAPDSDDFNFPDEFAIEGWFKCNAADALNYILSKWANTNPNSEFHINFLFSTATSKSVTVVVATDGNPANGLTLSTHNHDIDQGVWHHFLWERDADDVMRFYLDGVCFATMLASGWANGSGVLRLGGRNDLGGNYAGWIDEWRIVKGSHVCGRDAGFTVPSTTFPRS
jgi:hypothetical protein